MNHLIPNEILKNAQKMRILFLKGESKSKENPEKIAISSRDFFRLWGRKKKRPAKGYEIGGYG